MPSGFSQRVSASWPGDRRHASRDRAAQSERAGDRTFAARPPGRSGAGLVLAVTVFGFAGLGTFAALYARELGLDGAGPVFLVFSAVVVATRIVARQVPDRLGQSGLRAQRSS